MRAKPEDIYWENASKTISGFAPAAAGESYINYVMEGIVVPVVITPSMSFPVAGLTMDA
jgi:hypothetical protein